MSQSKNYQAKETQLNFECAQFHENTPTSSTENVISKPSSKEILKKLENKSRHEITEDDKLRTTEAFFQNHIKDSTDEILNLISMFFLGNLTNPSTIVWGLGGYIEAIEPFYHLFEKSKAQFQYLLDTSTNEDEKHIVLSLLKGIIIELMYQAIHLEDSEIDKPFKGLEIVSLFKCRKCPNKEKKFIEFYHSSYGDGICSKCSTLYEEKRVKNSDKKSILGGKITKQKKDELDNETQRPYILGHFPVDNNNNKEKGAFFIAPSKYWISINKTPVDPTKGLHQSFINIETDFIKKFISRPDNQIYNEIRSIRSTINNISNDVKQHVNAIFDFLKEILINIWKENDKLIIQDNNIQQTLNEKCSKALHELQTTDIISCEKMLESALDSLYAPVLVNNYIPDNESNKRKSDEINGQNEEEQNKKRKRPNLKPIKKNKKQV